MRVIDPPEGFNQWKAITQVMEPTIEEGFECVNEIAQKLHLGINQTQRILRNAVADGKVEIRRHRNPLTGKPSFYYRSLTYAKEKQAAEDRAAGAAQHRRHR